MLAEIVIRQVIGGLATGTIYGSVALALVVIYQSTHKINFAQGELAMFSTYLAWTLINAGVPYWAAFFATIAASFAIGAAIERTLIRPLAHAPVLATVTVFIGLLLLVNSVAGTLFGHSIRSFPSPFGSAPPFGSTLVSAHQLGAMAVCLAVLGIIFAFFNYTRWGLAMRAAAYNPRSTELNGVPVPLMITLGWGAAAAVGAAAGMMVAPIVFLEPHMMGGVLLYAFAGALLGGLTSPWGAMLGGIIVGVLENVLGAFVIGTELKMPVALVFIIAVLLVRPEGLLGRRIVTRV
jgi:branched-chain amino acid transport system permease protein